MPEKDKDAFRNTAEGDLALLHFDLGMVVWNEFGLQSDNNKLLASCGADGVYPAVHPDEVSTKIIEAAWGSRRGCRRDKGWLAKDCTLTR